MYNRYIPQPDGSYRRNRLPDPEKEAFRPPGQRGQARPSPQQEPPRPQEPFRQPEPPSPLNPGGQSRNAPRPPYRPGPGPNSQQSHHPPKGAGVTDFLRQLLPKDFDTEDLLIVLLLLLMSGDCKEDQNTALLTLALYLFM